MKSIRTFLGVLLVLLPTANVTASGPAGLYAILEKVSFEPNEQSPERMKIWGAFAFVEGGNPSTGAVAAPQRGYLYFTLSPSTEAQAQIIKKEWADLKAVAGKSQAIAFGNWSYIGAFQTDKPNQIFVTVQDGARSFRGIPLRVYNETHANPEPAPYLTNTGIVKLPETGSHATIVKLLKESLKR